MDNRNFGSRRPGHCRAGRGDLAVIPLIGTRRLDLVNPRLRWPRLGGRAVSARGRSGLVLRATADHSDDPARSAEMAAGLGARTAELEGLNHWWMMEDPTATVTALRAFWASLP